MKHGLSKTREVHSGTVGDFLGEEEPLSSQIWGGLPQFDLKRESTSLLIVDMVVGGAGVGRGGKWRLAVEKEVLREYDYYQKRLAVAIGNLQMLLGAFRSKRMEIIHGISRGFTRDGRDHKRSSKISAQTYAWWQVSEDNEVLEELKPLSNEIVIAKTGPSFFGVTDIDRVLTNLGVETLVVGGSLTHQCVESTVRDANDYGYNVVLAEDSCATHSPDLQRAAVRRLGDWYCKVRTTQDVFNEIMRL